MGEFNWHRVGTQAYAHAHSHAYMYMHTSPNYGICMFECVRVDTAFQYVHKNKIVYNLT